MPKKKRHPTSIAAVATTTSQGHPAAVTSPCEVRQQLIMPQMCKQRSNKVNTDTNPIATESQRNAVGGAFTSAENGALTGSDSVCDDQRTEYADFVLRAIAFVFFIPKYFFFSLLKYRLLIRRVRLSYRYTKLMCFQDTLFHYGKDA